MYSEIRELTIVVALNRAFEILGNHHRISGSESQHLATDTNDTRSRQRQNNDIDLTVHVRADTAPVRKPHQIQIEIHRLTPENRAAATGRDRRTQVENLDLALTINEHVPTSLHSIIITGLRDLPLPQPLLGHDDASLDRPIEQFREHSGDLIEQT